VALCVIAAGYRRYFLYHATFHVPPIDDIQGFQQKQGSHGDKLMDDHFLHELAHDGIL